MRARFARGRLTIAVTLSAAALVATPAAEARCATHRLLDDLWTKIPGPNLSGGGVLTGFDASDTSVGHLVATNGTGIGATDDGGCVWTDAALPEDAAVPPLALGEAKIVGQGISQVRFAAMSSTVVWAIGQTDVANEELAATQPRVLYSRNGGKSFASRVDGLPRFGRPVAVRGIGGQAAALLFKSTVPATTYTLFVTGDAGVTWREHWDIGPDPMADIVVDPVGFEVWMWSSSGLWHGTLRDRAPRPVTDVLGPVRTVDLGMRPGGRRTVTAYIAHGVERFVSTDGGVTFGAEPAPQDVQSASSHPSFPGLTALSSLETNVLVEPPPPFVGPLDFSPRDDNVHDVQFVGTLEKQGFPLYAANALSIYLRYVPVNFQLPPPRPEPPLPPVDVEVKRRYPPVPKPSIRPHRRVVTLRPGEKRTIQYEVTLPPVPTPLDVFFMTDSTNSMRQAIAGVQEGVQDIVDALAATGVDVHFGVADFRDYPENPTQKPQGRNGNYPYWRHREIGPIDTELEEALEGLTTGGGTADGDDSALEAMYQAATGAGRTDPIGVRGTLIPEGLGAEFRADSMKVILLASDDGMRHPDPANASYPGPSLSVVRQALVDEGIYLVGIEVKTSSSDSPREELEDLATATGAIAPEDGVDCDGDRAADLLAGEPIVCPFDSSSGDAIADAFIAMLGGIKDFADVDLTVTGRRSMVRTKARLHHPNVNVKAPNTFRLPVELRCTPQDYGTETRVRIGAHSRGEQIVSTTALVVCEAPEQPVPPVVPPAAVAVGFFPPPPPPPAPIPNAQPNVNPNLNPNPNPNPQPNAGFAAQEEQQLQLALAGQDLVLPEEDLAMSALDRTGPPLPAVAWATAFAMTGAAAFGLHLRRRTSPAPAFNPRSYR